MNLTFITFLIIKSKSKMFKKTSNNMFSKKVFVFESERLEIKLIMTAHSN
jgi:hypothetical protein